MMVFFSQKQRYIYTKDWNKSSSKDNKNRSHSETAMGTKIHAQDSGEESDYVKAVYG